jgi:predicted CXXCH cytochrome family protein
VAGAAALGCLLGPAQLARAQNKLWDPGVRPTTRAPTCTTSGCHAEQTSHEFLHGPTAVAACDMCHEAKSVEAHTFVLRAEGPELCTFCHIDKMGTEDAFVHQPVTDGECLSCHDPHGSNTRKLLSKGTMKELCISCHEQTLHGSMVHEPAGEGDCTVCHGAHTAGHDKLLVKEPRELCLSCHEALGHAMETDLHVHKPATGDCLECHAPHASDFEKHLRMAPLEMCTSCHVEQLEHARNAPHQHSAVLEDRACLNCHMAHTSSQKALQQDDPVAACLVCHGASAVHESVERATPKNAAAPVFAKPADGAAPATKRLAPPAPELMAGLPVAHGPVKDADCGACHDVHGAQHSRLLDLPYPESFYEPFSEQAYALCFNCHDRRLVMERETSSSTRFRDGDRNLHALHVNSEQGRTCRACHNTHASRSLALIGEAPAYGQWQIPLNFVSTETGGSCGPGCHKPAEYDRVTPAMPAAGQEGEAPAGEIPGGDGS